jgi:hypothetical protein
VVVANFDKKLPPFYGSSLSWMEYISSFLLVYEYNGRIILIFFLGKVFTAGTPQNFVRFGVLN